MIQHITALIQSPERPGRKRQDQDNAVLEKAPTPERFTPEGRRRR
jgi:hypothetical protein